METRDSRTNDLLRPTQQQVAAAPKTDAQLQGEFIAVCQQANELQLADNVASVFIAADIVGKLRGLLTESVVNHYFIPLMGTRVGFLTDRDKPDSKGNIPAPYPWQTVRDCIIDGACIGLAPVKNQFNIIAGNMYPTKEGYTALLKRIGAKYYITTSGDNSQPNSQTAEIECKVVYEVPGDSTKKNFTYVAYPKKNAYSSLDQLKGKAERKAKKALYELITGIDLGDADEDSGSVEDQTATIQARKDALRNSGGNAPKLL